MLILFVFLSFIYCSDCYSDNLSDYQAISDFVLRYNKDFAIINKYYDPGKTSEAEEKKLNDFQMNLRGKVFSTLASIDRNRSLLSELHKQKAFQQAKLDELYKQTGLGTKAAQAYLNEQIMLSNHELNIIRVKAEIEGSKLYLVSLVYPYQQTALKTLLDQNFYYE